MTPAKKIAKPVVPAVVPAPIDAGDPAGDRGPLGAHVSVAGGTWEAANRVREISATAAQIFTKQANRWAERDVADEERARFSSAMRASGARWTCAHDSYLINLASPDAGLRARSTECFRAELRRCDALGLDALVSHPGNYIDDRAAGIDRNADAIAEALEAEPGQTRLLMELTAGQGTVLGSTFEEMATLLQRLPSPLRSRVGVCLDTAHVWAAGYDIATDYDGVMTRFGDTIGFEQLGCLHLNDSKATLGSHLDRHECIGEGKIGEGAFRRIMTDERLAAVPKIIETPKGDQPAATDGRMLKTLRSFAALIALVVATIAGPALGAGDALHAQRVDDEDWRFGVELGAAIGGTWLDGSNVPKISARPGVVASIALLRGINATLAGGLAIRGVFQGLEFSQVGESWRTDGVRELGALAMFSVAQDRQRPHFLAVDLGGGAVLVSGPVASLPFRAANSFAPVGEIGASYRWTSGVSSTGRRDIGVFARLNMLRLASDPVRSEFTGGWVQRVMIGLRSAI